MRRFSRSLRPLVVTVLAVGVGLMAAAASADRAPRSETFRSDKGFSIDFPRDWEVKKDFMGTAVLALSPVELGDRFQENINVVVEPLGEEYTPKQYYRKSLDAMKTFFVEFRTKGTEVLEIGGRPTLRFRYSHRMEPNHLEVIAWFFTRGKTGYVVTGTANRSSFGDFEDTFDRIAGSFRLR